MSLESKYTQFKSTKTSGSTEVVEISTDDLEFFDMLVKIDIKKPSNKSKDAKIIFVFVNDKIIELNSSEIATSTAFFVKYFVIFKGFPPSNIKNPKDWMSFLDSFSEINIVENNEDDELKLAVFEFLSFLSDYDVTSDKDLFLTSENFIWHNLNKEKYFFAIKNVKAFVSQIGGGISLNDFSKEVGVLGLKEEQSVALRFGVGRGAVSKYWVIDLGKIKEYVNKSCGVENDSKE